jgi:oligopeptide/dipeptide ABC transporter ATP-binding protein
LKRMDENSPLLTARKLKKYFPVQRGFLRRTIGFVKAVDGVDFEIRPGRTLGLVGESGCGKSTVGRLLLRLLDPDGGEILYKGDDISRISQQEVKPLRQEMQIIFQDPFGSLNPKMTIGQSIGEGLRAKGLKNGRTRREKVAHLLQTVGLDPDSADRYPHEFSGGQRQRVGVARALGVEPALIVCDEPVSALDVSVQAQIINLLKDLQDRLQISYLFIAHDLNVVGYISDTVAVMYLGQIMEYATTDALFDRPLHPYTKALFSAVPVPDPAVRRGWHPLAGEVPSPFNPPPGCKFQGRCPLVEERCRRGEIAMYDAGPDHVVRCWKVVF